MNSRSTRLRHSLITSWSLAVILFVYLPTVCIVLASLTASRYFQFPIAKWGLDWWTKTLNSIEVRQLLVDVAQHCARGYCHCSGACILSAPWPLPAMTGKGRSLFQKLILLPIFFPQSVLGLALLLLWFNTLGLPLSWKTAVFAHLVWIVPVVTLVISIQVYSFDPALEEAAFDLGATRWQVLKEVTLPVLFPRHLFRRTFCLPSELGQFPALALHHGCRHHSA